MASFASNPRFRGTSLRLRWAKAANCPDFGDRSVLKDELWPRFNMVELPLLDESAFFADALCAAKVAKSREELEEMLGKKRDERVGELRKFLHKIFVALQEHTHKLEFDAAQRAASKVARTESLDSMLQFIGGSMFGWPREPADQRKPRPWVPVKLEYDEPIPDDVLETMNWTQYDSDMSTIPSLPPSPKSSDREGKKMSERADQRVLRASSTADDTTPHLPSPQTDTSSTVSDPSRSEKARLSAAPTDPQSSYPAPDSQSLPSLPNSVDDKSPPPIKHNSIGSSPVSSTDIAADPPCRKRRRRSNSDGDGNADKQCRRQKRRRASDTRIYAG